MNSTNTHSSIDSRIYRVYASCINIYTNEPEVGLACSEYTSNYPG